MFTLLKPSIRRLVQYFFTDHKSVSNLFFSLWLFSGGYVSNSLAIMTDAVHMLTDVVGILFSLLALWLSTKPPTKKFTFGLHRLGTCPQREAFTVNLCTSSSSLLEMCRNDFFNSDHLDVALTTNPHNSWLGLHNIQYCKFIVIVKYDVSMTAERKRS